MIVMLEQSLLAADVHGVVGVEEQVRETSGEVTYKILRDGAQGLLHFGRQFPVMVLLQRERSRRLRQRGCVQGPSLN